MARLAPLWSTNIGAQFRAMIRPSLVGMIGRVEPTIAQRASIELELWLRSVVSETLATTRLKDPNGEVDQQLRQGIKVIGRASLSNMVGRVDVYPWLRIQETGGTIVPVNAQYLTIPIFFGLRADGSPKFRRASSWRRFGSFVYTSKKTGKKFLAYKGAAGDLRILYILVDEVDVKPILGFARVADRRLGELLSAFGRIYIEEATRSGVINLWGARSDNE